MTRDEWRHAPEAWAEIWETSVSWDWDLGEARRICALRTPHVMGGADGKVSIERLYLSPYVEKPFNSKVINCFVPELRSRKCFSYFGIPMLSIYELWTFYVYFVYSCKGMLQIKMFTESTNRLRLFKTYITQSAGVVEYTDCTSAEG